jgi:hypothetical protein
LNFPTKKPPVRAGGFFVAFSEQYNILLVNDLFKVYYTWGNIGWAKKRSCILE